MRVISGKYRSIKLNSLEGLTTRPTTDKVKENLFNMIDVENCRVLDLFGGSGSLGIEAISRSAEFVTFIDGSKDAIKVINENLKKCKVDKNLFEVFRNDYLRALKIFNKKNIKFDVVFLDPPYKKSLLDSALKSLVDFNLLNDMCIVVCEYSSDERINYENKKLAIYKEKQYGSISLTIYEYRENEIE